MRYSQADRYSQDPDTRKKIETRTETKVARKQILARPRQNLKLAGTKLRAILARPSEKRYSQDLVKMNTRKN